MIARQHQQGVTLIEVLVSLLILGIGLLGAAALQLNALKFTDSSTMNSQASFIAYDMLDRIRANPQADYALTSLEVAPAAGDSSNSRTQDLFDFATNVRSFGGTGAGGSIAVNGRVVTINITWNDTRAANTTSVSNVTKTGTTLMTYQLVSRVAIDKGIL